MSMDLTGITNQNEYYTNHYFEAIFEENAKETLSNWCKEAKESEEIKAPWSLLRENAKQFYVAHDKYEHSKFDLQILNSIKDMADLYLNSLGYSEAKPEKIELDDGTSVPLYLEVKKANGAPFLWVMLAASKDKDNGILQSNCFDARLLEDNNTTVSDILTKDINNEEFVTKILFSGDEAPRFVLLIEMNQIALIDRNKWGEKRYLQFELEDIFSRREKTTLEAMAILLHKDTLCKDDGSRSLLDELDKNSQRHASGISQDLKYSLRTCIEELGNEVLYDMKNRPDKYASIKHFDAGQLTIECLRYMYRMLFVLFIESRPELGYSPIKARSYFSGYSLESLRDIADKIRDDVEEVGEGYYLDETISKLYDLIYNGYNEDLIDSDEKQSLYDTFIIPSLKAHVFDPEYTELLTIAKIRNKVMLRIIDNMSLTRTSSKKKERRGRISYSNLGINQMGAVYEALLSYRGFIAEEDLFEVKRAKDKFNELDVGYFIPESELGQYTEEERVYFTDIDGKEKLRKHEKGEFIYRLAGREREKSASYYTPESLTKCLVKYALKELLEGKTADDILQLTVCEPAMGSAAFLNEAINQLAEAYLEKKQKELGEIISYENRFNELQKVKMYIADRNVYGVDLNPVAVELAEVSLWLNTIYEGGYVPWFGTQLVNGNSLVGARRQCYTVDSLQASSKGLRWYENAPERVPLGTKRKPRKQIYHFLLGDPGMASYDDKVIKSLEPENIKKLKAWNKEFTKPYTDDEIKTLQELSRNIDELWEKQVELKNTLEKATRDNLSVYGYEDNEVDSHTSIRQKDEIYNNLYKSEHMKNAGVYARLKFAMDYWCSLWFWPIENADDLPTRSEFLSDMNLILVGTISTKKRKNVFENFQTSLFPTESEAWIEKIINLIPDESEVNLDVLCKWFPRLDIVHSIAEKNKFMHWEVEFADAFSEKGGFDLILGNPPWVKLEWNEKGVLSDLHPLFTVKELTANQVVLNRDVALTDNTVKDLYLSEYEFIAGEQMYLNSIQNYPDLRGQQTNLFKCFLPQAWMYSNNNGVSAYIHPEGVYDDPKGNALRAKLYPRLRRHYQFINEKLLFAEVGHPTVFSLNIYGNEKYLSKYKFHSISNLFIPETIDECYDMKTGIPEGIKNSNGDWSIKGHKNRVIYYGEKELQVLANLSGDEIKPLEAKLLALQTIGMLKTIKLFSNCKIKLQDLRTHFSVMWDETYSQNDGILKRLTHFPNMQFDLICSGPHIAVGNPLFKTPRAKCVSKGDYDCIDLTSISDSYLARSNYEICVDHDEYLKRNTMVFGKRYCNNMKLVVRKMLNIKQERTFNVAFLPKNIGHINGLVGIAFSSSEDLMICGSSWASVPVDFYLKVLGKSNFNFSAAAGLPVIKSKYNSAIIARGILLNCLTQNYVELYNIGTSLIKNNVKWSKVDNRLDNKCFEFSNEWGWETPLRLEYERRQALVEIDVLTAMALEMKVEELKEIYRIQFPVLQSYEADTWYDQNGRIVFTNNRSLASVGYSRPEWTQIKDAKAGEIFHREIVDDTMPGGPIKRTIEYVAPFDRCNREDDYETAWKFFEKEYSEENK